MTDVFLYSLPQLKKISRNFVKELSFANQGKKTSLAFIKNPLPKKPLVKTGEVFQVFNVGGSIFETATAINLPDGIKLFNYQKQPLPVIKNERIFLRLINKYLAKNISIVALNFAYALKPIIRQQLLDGQLLYSTKEHRFDDLVNKIVGEEIEKYILTKRKIKIKVSVANDTICLLLAGSKSLNKDSIAAGIVGTGTNFAFYLDENTAVNLESGNFNQFPQTPTGKLIDQKSDRPGEQVFEKEVSGAYLYQHYNLLINQNKIGKKMKIKTKPILSTFELSEQATIHPGGVKEGATMARRLIERSASLIACQIAGIYQFKKLKIKNLKLKIIMEGSLFWHGWQYQDFVKKYLYQLNLPKNGVEFVKIKNSTLIGASRLITG